MPKPLVGDSSFEKGIDFAAHPITPPLLPDDGQHDDNNNSNSIISCNTRRRRHQMYHSAPPPANGWDGGRAPFKNPGISRSRVWQIGTISFLLPPVPNWIETFSRAASASALSPFCFTDLMWGRRQKDEGERGEGERSFVANAPCRDLFEFSSPRDIFDPPKRSSSVFPFICSIVDPPPFLFLFSFPSFSLLFPDN